MVGGVIQAARLRGRIDRWHERFRGALAPGVTPARRIHLVKPALDSEVRGGNSRVSALLVDKQRFVEETETSNRRGCRVAPRRGGHGR